MSLKRHAFFSALCFVQIATAEFKWTHLTGGALPSRLHLHGDTLYMGTENNLVLLDTRTHSLTIRNTGNYPLMTNVLQPFLDSKNGLWVSSYGGVFRVQDGKAERKTIPNENVLGSPQPIAFDEDPQGGVWASSLRGLIRYDADSSFLFDSTNSPVRDLPEPWDVAPSGRVWIRAKGLLYSYQNGNWTPLPLVPNCGPPGNGVLRMREDEKGRLWVMGLYALARYDSGRCEEVFPALPSNYGLIYSDRLEWKSDIRFGPDGEAWINLEKGLLRVSDTLTFFDMTTGSTALPSAVPPQFAVGGSDLLWVYTNAGFIHRFTPSSKAWQSIPVGDTTAPYSPSAVIVDHAGIPWFGTSEGIHTYENGAWKGIFGENEGLNEKRVTDLAEDPEGRIWALSGGGVLLRFQDRKRDYSESNYPPFGVGILENDPKGRLVVGPGKSGDNLYARLDGNTWTSVFRPSDCTGCIANAFAFDTSEAIWIGTDQGVFRHSASKQWTRFHMGNSGLPVDRILSVAVDGMGKVYAGHTQGLSVYDGQTWKTFSATDFGFTDFTMKSLRNTKVKVDPKGRVWVTQRNIVWGDIYAWMAVFDGKWTVVSQAEGLPDYAAIDMAFDSNGKGWFATTAGVCNLTETTSGMRLQRLPFRSSINRQPSVDVLGRPALDRKGIRPLSPRLIQTPLQAH